MRLHLLILFLFSFITAINVLEAYAEEVQLNKTESVQTESNNPELNNTEEENEALKEKNLKIGFILLGGVIFIGGFSIFLILMWGHRVKRVIREPLVPYKKIDPLWFLKSKNQQQSKDEGNDSETENESGESKTDE